MPRCSLREWQVWFRGSIFPLALSVMRAYLWYWGQHWAFHVSTVSSALDGIITSTQYTIFNSHQRKFRKTAAVYGVYYNVYRKFEITTHLNLSILVRCTIINDFAQKLIYTKKKCLEKCSFVLFFFFFEYNRLKYIYTNKM